MGGKCPGCWPFFHVENPSIPALSRGLLTEWSTQAGEREAEGSRFFPSGCLDCNIKVWQTLVTSLHALSPGTEFSGLWERIANTLLPTTFQCDQTHIGYNNNRLHPSTAL